MRLTFAQAIWGITTLVLLCGAWFDMRSQVHDVVVALGSHELRIAAIEKRNETVGFTKSDAAEMRYEIVQAIKAARR